MGAIKAGSKVLVTGASGYIGAWTAKEALAKGLNVVGTVRSPAKGDYLKKLLGNNFEYAIVEDISQENAFDKVVKEGNFDAILHTASPFHFKADDPDDLIKPAVRGTVGILESVTKAGGNNVKRVVITSSVAAVSSIKVKPPRTWTEADWNDESPQTIKEKGREAPNGEKYRASKTLAERAAWKYVEDNKTPFDLVAINPTFVFGPIIHECNSPDSLNTSVHIFYEIMKGSKKEADLPGPMGNWVDVRDVADAHVQALLQEQAGGNRYITSVGPFCAQEFNTYLNKIAPELNLPQGKEGGIQEANDPQKVTVSKGTKAEKELGIKFKTLEETTKDMYESLKEREQTVWKA